MAPNIAVRPAKNEVQLADAIRESTDREHVVRTTLQTNEQVIARVTDGIYRLPGSALRELISNAYDADASRVVIKTDAPRFDKITIEDDGAGMSPDVLAHLLFNIGGSAKRNNDGERLGVTAKGDNHKSPKGRVLIGKIGIGLFSVAQLTHSFQIVTKTKSDTHRTIATVALRQFSDNSNNKTSGEERFESGKVTIWRERAVDTNSHGTTIILSAVRPQARNTLRSHEIWSAIEHNDQVAEDEEKQTIEPPRFHIGRTNAVGETLNYFKSLPYDRSDKPEVAFSKLVDCVWNETQNSTPNPKLENIFDHYLQMIWQLALSVPLDYVNGHLFDEEPNGWTKTFLLSNKPKGSAQAVTATNTTIRSSVGLTDSAKKHGKFDVFIDELKLARPIKFRGLPMTSHALSQPLVFVGKCSETFPKMQPELSGGPLKFEAYLFWAPKIAPTEHQGSLIRIHGASGTGFDQTFMRYQVSEQNRLRQITCEIFVSEGLDSALNIDRESFNNAHPHAVFITRWLFGALRQLATTQKKEAGSVRKVVREEAKNVHVSEIRRIAADVWAHEADDVASSPPTIQLFDDDQKRTTADSYGFRRAAVTLAAISRTPKERARVEIIEEKLKAITQLLASFNLLDRLSRRKQEALMLAIYKILNEREE